jgi:hypothetical protein
LGLFFVPRAAGAEKEDTSGNSPLMFFRPLLSGFQKFEWQKGFHRGGTGGYAPNAVWEESSTVWQRGPTRAGCLSDAVRDLASVLLVERGRL